MLLNKYIEAVKRESGENPERSGHCKHGARFKRTIELMRFEKDKSSDDVQARKPAEIFSEWLPTKALHLT